jgi:hypothetical protein
MSEHKETELMSKVRIVENEAIVSKEIPIGKCPLHLALKDGKQVVTFREPYTSPLEAMISGIKHLTGVDDFELAADVFDRGTTAMPKTKSEQENINIMLQSLANGQPKDLTQARLCMQATALYAQGMHYLSRAEKSDILPRNEFYMKCACKLLRLHNETIEALSKYSRGGEQRVVVQHVNVNEGGKAIVGNVMSGG